MTNILETSILSIKKRFIYFLFFLLIFYVFSPYFFWYWNNFFIDSLIMNIQIYEEPINTQKYLIKIINKININYIFFTNLFLFLGLFIYFYFLNIFQVKHNGSFIYIEILNKLLVIVVFICIIFLIKDLYEFYNHIKLQTYDVLFELRGLSYRFFQGRRQTHFVIGSIISIYLICQKNYKLPIFCLFLIFVIEIFTLSRFYIFLCFLCLTMVINKKYLKFLLILLILIATYRIFLFQIIQNFVSFNVDENFLQIFSLSSEIKSFSFNFFWEPISLWSTEIVKLLNFTHEIAKENFVKKFILDNLNMNFIFFDQSKTYYVFRENVIPQFGSYSNFGLIDTIAYPIQSALLVVLTLIISKRILQKVPDLRLLFLLISIYASFKIIRGSSIDGLSFILKFEILLLLLLLIVFIIKKLNFFKSSS